MDDSVPCDPLSMNLYDQWAKVAHLIDRSLVQQHDASPEELVKFLSRLLYDSRYTLLIAKRFRPILFVLCAIWLDQQGDEDEKLSALALLILPHEELFPILSSFIRGSYFFGGILTGISSLNISQLHLRLLAYYRILTACPHAPALFQWPAEELLQVLPKLEIDNGVRWLTVRCYALHTGMSEGQRDKLEMEILGSSCENNASIEVGRSLNGETQLADGWLLPVHEAWRVHQLQQEILEAEEFYNTNDDQFSTRISLESLTHRVADIHGILVLKSGNPTSLSSNLITTPSTIKTLRALATCLSLRLPILFNSPPSSGKYHILGHLASLLCPASARQLVTVHLSDTSIDVRSLFGSYVSSTQNPGVFEWQEGVIVKAMRYGLWLVLKDIDRASPEVLASLSPLIESLAAPKHVGAPASLEIPGRGKFEASESFAIFATRSVPVVTKEQLPTPAFFGCNKFSCVDLPMPTEGELITIVNGKFPRFGPRAARAIICAWIDVKSLGFRPGVKGVGIHELMSWCRRIEGLVTSGVDSEMGAGEDVSLELLYPHVGIREEMYLAARDVFFGGGVLSESARHYTTTLARTFARHLGLSHERSQWLLERSPDFEVEKHSDGRTRALKVGRTRLIAACDDDIDAGLRPRPFAMHRHALLVTQRIATCISLAEPVLLVGETGTGKTTLISHIASSLHRRLFSLNLSHQTESSDILGGFKPVNPRVLANEIQIQFLDLFTRTFSRRKNNKFEETVRKALRDSNWKRSVELWKECTRVALVKIKERNADTAALLPHSQNQNDTTAEDDTLGDHPPSKRRRLGVPSNTDENGWLSFGRQVEAFENQHVHGQGKFVFDFVEGPLIQALRNGHWILLDEINLASSETLECISSIIQSPTASIVLTEQGSFEPVPRHPDFRLFACMNPATDVGKKDLPENIRSRFTEIYVSSPDADREVLLAIVHQYIGHCSLADKAAPLDVTEFYLEVKHLAEQRELADGSNHRAHFSLRTLTRALSFTSDMVLSFGLRRALWEGCLMAFSMGLDEKSILLVRQRMEKHLLAGVRNVNAMMTQIPPVPDSGHPENFERIGPFWLQRGALEPDSASEYVLTPSVQSKLMNLARAIITRRFPVLIEGPTSSGKTSAVEYLARRTGHRFIRVNNHEHTDIQEYMGAYVSDPMTGKLVFNDGILVRALRNGDWIVLDELNLAPTDVLEALNRLLDDNRELIIPETHEVIRPHPHFMLFATQNPPGLYAGRKVLSRAFRSRFLEVQFDDVPQSELQTILSERCRIPESYAHRIVAVFGELSKRRQAARVFESKHGFATLRDLFRWANREASSIHQLAQNGYMLLAERTRRPDDKEVVKEVIEMVMKETIDLDSLYDLRSHAAEFSHLGINVSTSPTIVWTYAMRRLFVLIANALRYNEPVLLVGNTGSGKTSVCQIYADGVSKTLSTLNCHQSTETADLIGSQRPLRNRVSSQAQLLRQAQETLHSFPEFTGVGEIRDVDGMLALLKQARKISTLPPTMLAFLGALQSTLQNSNALFEWCDGPLVRAMRSGEIFLLDEISLADDSVLERLNSVLEPARNIVLAEHGGLQVEQASITAHPDFKLLATMNPGGDYGKKELSPALRNRFTEIWVPQVDMASDLRMIIEKSWRHESLLILTDHILAFTQWLASVVGVASVASLRDILGLVDFANGVLDSDVTFPTSVVFHHAAEMTFLDGLETSVHTSSWPADAVHSLRERAHTQLEKLVPLADHRAQAFDVTLLSTSSHFTVGPFSITKGPFNDSREGFSLHAPTVLDNVRRLVRACQLSKPILLEGSPGVGKTSLIEALGNMTGHRVCRINLSNQTDLVDLFGSDFPVDSGNVGEFAWKDAAFLKAMQEGDWVLLDEMNLAPQPVLEGLNAVLDHRGAIFIPELGRSFTKHARFRVFAAQNPLYQGGGRKGLPKSYLDRFTKVHIRTLTTDDHLVICQNLFPTLSQDWLRSMVDFNSQLHQEITVNRSFGRVGGPWEFNLRDIIRWATLLTNNSGLGSALHPSEYLDALYLQRFRSEADRSRVVDICREVFNMPLSVRFSYETLWTSTTSDYAQFGFTIFPRGDCCPFDTSVELQRHLRPLTAASLCLEKGWLIILSGNAGVGKTQLIRYLASKTGHRLCEFSMNHGVDTADILGSFEQVTSDKGITRFEWIDGPLVRAMKEGHWMVLDNANLCGPSILDRLNSLCEPNGFLALTERGSINGDVELLKPHPRFRLILTVDPHNGELSRAMRNRAIEIYILSTPTTPQDNIRLLDAVRVPPISSTVDKPDIYVLQYELVRRANSCIMRHDTASKFAMRRGVLKHDHVASFVLDCAIITQMQSIDDLRMGDHSRALFAIRMIAPSMFSISRRLWASNCLHLQQNSSVPIPEALFVRLEHHPIWTLRHTVGESIAKLRGVSCSFILAQPLDFLMNPKLLADSEHLQDLAGQLHVISAAIGLFVHTYFRDHSEATFAEAVTSVFHKSRLYYQSQNDSTVSHDVGPGLLSIFPLYSSTMSLAHQILRTVTVDHCEEQLILLEATKELVDLAEHLRNSASGPHFDFSSAMIISKRFNEVLASNGMLASIQPHVGCLSREVSLTSGHGMQEIWNSLVLPNIDEKTRTTLDRLDSLLVCLKPNTPSYDRLREDGFNVMSMLTINLSLPIEKRGSIIGLGHDIENRIKSCDMLPMDECSRKYSPPMAISELEFLSLAFSPKSYHNIQPCGNILIKLATRSPRTSLARLTPVQRCLWMSDAYEDQSTERPAILMSLVQEWMSAMEDITIEQSCITFNGPEVILKPILLNEMLWICFHDQPLHALESYEKSLLLHGTFLTTQCQSGTTNRLDQISTVWLGTLTEFARCFKESYSLDTWHEFLHAASCGRYDEVAKLLPTTSNIHLLRVIHDHLIPACHSLDQPTQVELERISAIGNAWIHLGLAFLEFYIPNIPLDPLAAQSATSKFWQNREAEVAAQIRLHESAEEMITGENSNPFIYLLRNQLSKIHTKLSISTPASVCRDVDMGRLHALFNEINPFVTQILRSTKFKDFISNLMATDKHPQSYLSTVQATISGMISRLRQGHAYLADIIQPINTGLSALRFGLQLSSHRSRSSLTKSRLVGRLQTLVKFPTVTALEDITEDMIGETVSSRQHLFYLVASAYEFGLGNTRTNVLSHLDDTYGKLLELWLQDLNEQTRVSQASQSLYRQKAFNHDMLPDADLDEKEFNSMFPNFDETATEMIREDQSSVPSYDPLLKVQHLSTDDKERIYRLHLWMMDCRHSGGRLEFLDREYHELRTPLIREMLASHLAEFPHSLDLESLAYQSFLLSSELKQLNGDRPKSPAGYNFYHDPNVLEVRKASLVVLEIQRRSVQLMRDWPDQMVLQHLMTRCEAVLQLNVHTPVAKVLTRLEQLIPQLDDWEMYSNEKNSLKPQQVALSQLIVDWRRLELSCWSHLLESQYVAFSTGTAEWWFRLYELVIRGTLSAVADGKLPDVFFAEMICLVEQFVTTGSLGQFGARLQLLHSFGLYSEMLSHIKHGVESTALGRASRILQSLHRFYGQLARHVSEYLAEKRSVLEKELLDYIKLASWKDANVYALKQSVQRTHRQLFKCVRKFRELLREPVTPLFLREPSDLTLQTSGFSTQVKPVFMCQNLASPVSLPSVVPSDDMPHHMQDLSGTFATFEHLLKTYSDTLTDAIRCDLIDNFAGQISETVTALSSATEAACGNMKLQKTLMMQKRKAWIDLLQELRRAGVPTRLKPDILQRQQDKVWLLDRLATMNGHSPFQQFVLKVEDYFNRMLFWMPELRSVLSSHHGDIPTRDLQRAAIFVESSFGMALAARERFVTDYQMYQKLDKAVRRLRSLSATEGSITNAYSVSTWLEICRKAEHALEEISAGCLRLEALNKTAPLSHEVLTTIATQLDIIRKSHHALITLRDNFDSTHKKLMTTEEQNNFHLACTHILSTTDALRRCIDQEPRISHLCNSFLAWFLSTAKQKEPLVARESQTQGMQHVVVIDHILIIVQEVVSAHHTFQLYPIDQSPDNYAAECEDASNKMSRMLAVGSVVQLVDSFLNDLSVSSMTGRLDMVRIVTPFLDSFLRYVENFLLVQVQLVKSLFKLSYILCRVVLSLGQKGFCKPAEMENESLEHTVESKEVQGAPGIGQGTGSENVSSQIQDESQVEGLRNEEATDDQPLDAADADAVEMGEEFDGDTQTLDDDTKENGSDDGNQSEVDDEIDEVNMTDRVVDEKFWENNKATRENADPHSLKDRSTSQKQGSEIVAKDNQDEWPSSRPDDSHSPSDKACEETASMNDLEVPEEHPADAGRQVDNPIPEAHTLDLPEDLDLGIREEEQMDTQSQDDVMCDEDESPQTGPESHSENPAVEEFVETPSPLSQREASPIDHMNDMENNLQEITAPDVDSKQSQATLTQSSMSTGDGQSKTSTYTPGLPFDDMSQKAANGSNLGEVTGEDVQLSNESTVQSENSSSFVQGNDRNIRSADAKDSVESAESSAESMFPNPLRNLEDTLKEVSRRWQQIDEPTVFTPSAKVNDQTPSQVEYLQGVDEDYDMQALGPARKDHIAKLSELQIVDQEPPRSPGSLYNHIVEVVNKSSPPLTHADSDANAPSKQQMAEDLLTHKRHAADASDNPETKDESYVEPGLIPSPNRINVVPDEAFIELTLRKWLETGHSDSSAGEMWRLYEALTQDLSSALCEQLRLILEPTLATRLRGDYRTGKRLNMKKIIPYIASEYTKDKIWLRRTHPSQREYQILIALDDSRSMAEGRSIHLAYETLVLVSKALNRLESGEVAIARFGEYVEIVHGFEDGVMGEREGEKVMQRFRFDQHKTDVLGLLDTSLRAFTQARERKSVGRSSSSAVDLWQLEIIISDGICQDHDKLRTILRKAEEQRVMVVFLVIDSLHTHDSSSNTQSAGTPQTSILSMNQVSYKDIGGGQMELQLNPYLSSFPFQYYVVLRSVEALPEVLSGTLKQFLERISEE